MLLLGKDKRMRKPKVKNKYNLTPAKINKLIVNRELVGEPIFWRNNVINAWCISVNTAKNSKDMEFGTYSEFWLGVYDEDAKSYAGKVRHNFTAYGGMCGYNFKKFFNFAEIENELDLIIQEMAIEKLNHLIDEGILILPN